MKKKLSLVCLFFLAAVLLTGCVSQTAVEIKKGREVSLQFDSIEDAEHEIGRVDEDGWAANNSEDLKHGDLAVVRNVALRPGVYELSWEAMVDFNAVPKEIVGQIAVRDAQTGDSLKYYDVRRGDFPLVYEYAEVKLIVPVYREQRVDIIFAWNMRSYVCLRKLNIRSVSPQNLADNSRNGAVLLGSAPEEVALTERSLIFFDLTRYLENVESTVDAYDLANLLFTLQGLVNRDGPRLFINFSQSADKFWLNELRRPGEYLADREIVTVRRPITVLSLFQSSFAGFTVWDENVPATVNAAATACGVENLLPLRYSEDRSGIYAYLRDYSFTEEKRVLDLYGKFTGTGTIWDTKQPSSGSAKNDAYRWAKEKYLDAGRTNAHLLAYHVDAVSDSASVLYYGDLENRFLSNKDYYIMNRAFFFDLNVWPSTLPDDDKSQPVGTDYATLTSILRKQNELAGSEHTTVGGFIPWHVKYTAETDFTLPGAVDTESQSVFLFSMYNCVLDAEAPHVINIANASVYSKVPQRERFENRARAHNLAAGTAERAKLANKNYLLVLMGDYDASAWTNSQMIQTYLTDPARGELPLVWPIAANNVQKIPHVFNRLYEEQTDNDYFAFVNCGIGQFALEAMYSPAREPGLNGTAEAYMAKTKAAGERFGLDIFPFIGSLANFNFEALKQFAYEGVKGIGTVNAVEQGTVVNGVPVLQIKTLNCLNITSAINDLQGMGDRMVNPDGSEVSADRANFFIVRTILTTPTFISEMYDQLRQEWPNYNFEIVDPYTFFHLYQDRYAA